MHSLSRLTHAEEANRILTKGFYQCNQLPDIKRTHLFDGRYENIYLDNNHIPELDRLIEEAIIHASKLINTRQIQAGYWFNYMPPGSVTTAHSHDDDDELLSAVYYISVPPDSGDLMIHCAKKTITIKPEAGMFVFFKPNVIHEVTENKSEADRLSIGFNFGPKK